MKLPRITVFYGWYIVGATFLTGLLSGGFFTFGIGVFFPEVKAEFSLQTHAPLAAIFGIAPLEGAILGPFQGFFVDRFGPRRVMLLGITLNGLGWVLAATSQSLGMFAVFFLLIAAGNGMGLTAPPLATVGNWFIRKRGIAFGIATAGFGLGTVFLPLVNYLIDSLDWRTTAVVIGVVAYASTFTWLGLLTTRALGFGLVYVLLWEALITSFLSGTRYLSIRSYIFGTAYGLNDSFGEDLTIALTPALVGAALVTVVFFLLTVRRLSRMDVP